jgi:polygalacturonase
MQIIQDQTFDQERALYGSRELTVQNCRFDGPADGESAFKECSDIRVADCYFNLRYPFWHVDGLMLEGSELTLLCRAALWYTQNATIAHCALHGIKALRECSHITLRKCDIESAEFGWSVHDIEMEDCTVRGEYFMMRSTGLRFQNVALKGKYSFQYIEDAVFENCNLDTKDAFWHAKNVIVRNCTVKGEYLAWYCENVTFENCTIIGTQPLCYCKGLKLINCRMEQTDLSFERSEVEATVVSPVVSIKNPLSGCIYVPSVGEVIRDESTCVGKIIVDGRELSGI